MPVGYTDLKSRSTDWLIRELESLRSSKARMREVPSQNREIGGFRDIDDNIMAIEMELERRGIRA